jgi:hypothetical protein
MGRWNRVQFRSRGWNEIFLKTGVVTAMFSDLFRNSGFIFKLGIP